MMIKRILGLLCLTLMYCSSDDNPQNTQPQDITPTNLLIHIDKSGSSTSMPNGDGSGIVTFVATATDAVSYAFRIDSGQLIPNASGTWLQSFTTPGTTEHTIEAVAYSSSGNTSSVIQQFSIYVEEITGEQLIWSDEFNNDGAPSSSKWTYDIGGNGWGNGEYQFYTARPENVIVENGYLKIIAKRENYGGKEFTSARLISQNLFEFQYGRVEIRAKLPQGAGTWPALWMLGANFSSSGWPTCGEMDIMEHWGSNQNIISGATHTPSSYGNTVNKGEVNIPGVSEDFHLYGINWSSEKLEFTVDGSVFYTYNPPVKNDSTWPFDQDFFLICNVAMGSFWETVDPNFVESTMEVDYIRVYQE